ncbi:DNA repair and recombination protein rhm52 [Hypsizygus marmoreus]|uniref:DNA repair and recombination protein rhm52 n=1 Tax=Hypsizygus marmoreus TaxID=39966 RepID=A0A369KDD5_HYPMA|nr:DNA repair and recombination protein rhm52 [Hypsizygus marmoreus]
MAGAFSGHLVNSFYANQGRSSTLHTPESPHIVTSGAMSFNSQMHGTPFTGNYSMTDSSFSFNSPQQSFFNPELSEATTLKVAALQAKLNQKLGPEYISQRPGPGGGPKLTYAEGWKIINLANEVFGFNGWSTNVVSLTTDFIDFNEESRRYSVGTTAIVRVTLRDGVYHEDIGYGLLENAKSKGAALDKCKKEAVTDGLKRALRNFGNLLGNCLYDKSYAQEVVKIKVPPPKFDKSELHRRPEFEERKPNLVPLNAPSSGSTTKPTSANDHSSNFVTPTRPSAPQAHQQPKVLSSLPIHIRTEVAASGSAHHNRNSTSDTTTSMSKAQPCVPKDSSTSLATSTHGHATSISMTRRNMPPPPPPRPEPKPSTVLRSVSGASDAAAQHPPVPAIIKDDVDDAEESFHFYSDDDAFLALVDLGEGDLGQPILSETDLGRPIGGDDSDIDLSRGIDAEESLHGSNKMRGQGDRSSLVDSSSTTSGRNQQSAPSVGMLSRLLPQHQQRTALQPQHRHLSGQASMSGQNHNQNQNHGRPSNPNQTFNNNHHNQNQNPNANTSTNANQQSGTAAATATAKRPTTPSMGGFHFPPGVNPHQQQQQARPPPSSGIGQKRPLDAMASTTTNRRPGMGLDASGTGGPGQVKREVFGRLDVDDGGDVKRMRR